MTDKKYMQMIGFKGNLIEDKFLANAIEVYHAYFGNDKVSVILKYAEQKRNEQKES